LWRALLCRDPGVDTDVGTDFEILFLFDHRMGDGNSGVIFAKSFVEIYNSGTVSNEKINRASPLVEHVMEIRPTFGTVFGALADRFISGIFKKSRDDFLGLPDPEVSSLETKLAVVSLTSADLKQLSTRCQENSTTIHSAICAAAFFACAKVYQSRTGKEKIKLSCDSPISVRKFCNHINIDDAIGLYVCPSTQTEVISKNSDFWNVARKVKRSMERTRDKDTQVPGLLSFVTGSWDEYVNVERLQGLLHKRTASLEVSNLGRVEFAQSSSLQIKEACFAQGNHYPGPLFCNSVVTTNQKLNCVISVPSPLVRETDISDFAKHLKLALQWGCND